MIAKGTAKELKSKVGNDRLELVFTSDKNMRAAAGQLKGDSFETNDKDNSLTLQLRDTNKDIRRILDALADKNITFESMSVHKPTLDDVFLSLTGKQKKTAQNVEEA